jgi:hypothetical protein
MEGIVKRYRAGTHVAFAAVTAALLAACPSPESAPGPDAGPEPSNEVCGNGTCEAHETASSCPADCNHAICGNNTCEPGETSASCPQDCGAPATCGDGVCNGNETAASCPNDCDASLYVVNDSSYSIWYLYVAACGAPTWGNDVLGSNVIPPGYTLTLHGIQPGCWGFRAQTEDGSHYWQTQSGVNLTEAEQYTWTLY